MANRKVLINRHTSGNTAPNPAEMYLGEIAVAHETGKETLFTKNNAGNMVPFISCAQTISIIDGKIAAADVTYDVKAAQNDAHVDVVSGGTEKAKVFTVSSKDVQSKAAFETYSAATDATIKQNYNTLSGAIDDVLAIITTAITGDDIIKVQPTTSGAGTYSLSHKEATAVTGFNKLATDAYGHVTASTAVSTSDIQALGFKTSAETKADLEALSASVVTNKSNIEALSAGTQHDIKALSGNVVEYVKVVSGNIETVINELSANTMAGDAAVFASAKTYTDEAIKGLDSSISAATGKYFTALAIENGKLVAKEEASIPVLEVESEGTGNVVSSIAVNDHKITYQTVSVATSEDIQALSASVINLSAVTGEFSGATDAKFTALSAYTEDVDDKVKALSAGTISISGFAHGEIVELSGATVSAFTAILGMDKAADAVAGKVVTTVSEVDGVVSETKANVKDLQLGGYVKDANATGAIAGTDTINTALSKLENIVAANKISNADGSIVVTEPTGTATTTDVKVNIKSGEKVIKLDGEGGGLYTNLNLVKITESLPATVKERYEFRDSDNNKIGESIDIAKDSHIVSITYDETTQKLIYKYLDASGVEQTTEVDMAHLILETEVENGIQSVNGKLSIKLDTTGDDTGDGKFLTVGENGLKLDGVTDAINAAVNGLNYADTAVAGQYVTEVDETNGVISVQRANVSDAVLNGYAKGEKPASTAIAATDDVKGAIAKLEHQIDDAKAAATTKVVEGTDEGNNMTIVSATGADNSVTYTVNLTDVASKTALTAEIAARKDVDGQTGQTYAANANTNYITGATSLNDADVKLDAALKAEETARANQDDVIEGAVGLNADGTHKTTTGNYTSAATTVVGEIAALDNALKDVADQVGDLDYTGLTNENTKVVTNVKQDDGLVSASATTVGDLVITAITTADTKVAANDNLATIAGKLQGQINAMDSTAQTSGNSYFLTSVQLADGKITAATQSDKVNSASTADSADKVKNALTMTDGTATQTYDGSEAKSLTFGTATSVSGRKSMSMTSDGLVDVEIIDCGTY